MFKPLFFCAMMGAAMFVVGNAAPAKAARCSVPDNVIAKVTADFYTATGTVAGGIFTPKLMWGAIVDRDGRLCNTVKTGDAWPGSRAIAIAKASTANDFSNNKLALSTAMLYGLAIPGGSLYGLNASNPFNPLVNDPRIPAQGYVPGGIITFGGGVALYAGTTVIGGLGVSGDTSCSDHDVAYITRRLAIRDHVLSAPPSNDNIIYANPVVPNTFTHPVCLNSGPPPAGDTRAVSGKQRLMIIQ